MRMQAAYDRSYEPPAPSVSLLVAAPDDEAPVLVTALVDSGADLCVVPAALAQHLDLPLTDVLQVAGVGGAQRSATVHAAAINLAGRRELVEVVALGDEMLVGRNFLRSFVATLDGPQEQLTVISP